MEVTAIAIDLAKSVFQLHCVDSNGKAILRKTLSRGQLVPFLAKFRACKIGMEACGGSNFWAREVKKLGHEVVLISPQFVKPFLKSNKNDRADAEAICEAMLRPSMRFVAPKSIEQQDIQSLQRVRGRLVAERTALVNEARGLLAEYGVVLPVGVSSVRKSLPLAVEKAVEGQQMTSMSRETFLDLHAQLLELDEKIERYDCKINAIHKAHPVCQRLSEIPGIGPITSTAIVSAVADPHTFKNGREFSAWLGLVPRQHSSGGKELLLGISKRGDVHLRTLLIHGARTVIRWRMREAKLEKKGDWLEKLVERRGVNRASVALANKNARVMWALMARSESYRPTI